MARFTALILTAFALPAAAFEPLTIVDQGSFAAGGTTLQTPRHL